MLQISQNRGHYKQLCIQIFLYKKSTQLSYLQRKTADFRLFPLSTPYQKRYEEILGAMEYLATKTIERKFRPGMKIMRKTGPGDEVIQTPHYTFVLSKFLFQKAPNPGKISPMRPLSRHAC